MKNQTKNKRRDATLNEVACASRRVREHAPLGGVVEDVRADGAGYDDAETSMMTCTLVPAFAGSCLNRINKNGKMVPMHVLAVTMAKREVEMANGPTKSFAPSGLVRITRAKPAVESAVARSNPT